MQRHIYQSHHGNVMILFWMRKKNVYIYPVYQSEPPPSPSEDPPESSDELLDHPPDNDDELLLPPHDQLVAEES